MPAGEVSEKHVRDDGLRCGGGGGGGDGGGGGGVHAQTLQFCHPKTLCRRRRLR